MHASRQLSTQPQTLKRGSFITSHRSEILHTIHDEHRIGATHAHAAPGLDGLLLALGNF